MRRTFSLSGAVAAISIACIVLAIVHYESPAVVAIFCNILAFYIAASETVVYRWLGSNYYIRRPRSGLEWAVLIGVVLLINLAAFGPIATRVHER